MICKNCGNFNEDAADACIVCGADLKADSAPVTDDFSSFGTDGFTPDQSVVTPVTPDMPAEDPGKTLGLIGMIAGILSIVASCCIPFLGIPFSIAAVVCGFLGMNKSKAAGFKNTLAIVGIAVGAVGIIVAIINAIAGGIIGAVAASGGFNF